MRIKKNDTVIVLTGKDKGKRGTVLEIDLKHQRVRVQGIAIMVKHEKPRRQGTPGTIRREEGFIAISNVMPISKGSAKPCRVNYKIDESGHKIRVAHESGEPI